MNLPTEPEDLFKSGNLAFEAKDYPAAFEFFRKAAAAKPGYADAYLNAGNQQFSANLTH